MGIVFVAARAGAQERIKVAYSSADASNMVWFSALDTGFYRKHGLDVELVFLSAAPIW
jgi:ABC-type nitrate/sulfonate/bicarbonate transport system substrate-binding protein